MKSNNSNGWLIAALCLGAASIIAWVDFGIYVSRLDDAVGIGLNAVIAVAFTIAAAGFFLKWSKTRNESQK